MNYLAHLYLSGVNPEIKIGNFIADSVKGRNLNMYPVTVQKGIMLHRFIDYYTDTNTLLTETRKKMQLVFPKYYGLILDVYLDHFLANRWENYSDVSLKAYVRHFYLLLVLNYFIIPPRVRRSLPYLISQNWLESYKDMKGMGLIFDRMHKHRGLPWSSAPIMDYMKENYKELDETFVLFFADLHRGVLVKAAELKLYK